MRFLRGCIDVAVEVGGWACFFIAVPNMVIQVVKHLNGTTSVPEQMGVWVIASFAMAAWWHLVVKER